jgi:hypothetical protein
MLTMHALRSYLAANHDVDTFAFRAISGKNMIEKFGYRACGTK